jgi:glycine C-acetyltransferase/8-amino-7-oxononanoate synthase
MGLQLLTEQPEMRADLNRNVKHMRAGIAALGLEVADSPVPIVSVHAPADLALIARQLEERDIFVLHVPPSGYSDAPDHEALRIAVFSTHSTAQIDALVGTLGELL